MPATRSNKPRGSLRHTAVRIPSRQSGTVPVRYALAVFRAAAQRGAGAFLFDQSGRQLLVGDQIQRYHACRYQRGDFLIGLEPWRLHAARHRAKISVAELHRDGRARACKTVSPMFTPTHLDKLAILIRERSADVLDHLPPNET